MGASKMSRNLAGLLMGYHVMDWYPIQGHGGEVISKISGRMDILTSFFPWCLNGDSLLLQRPCHLYQSPPPFASGALPYLLLLTCQVL